MTRLVVLTVAIALVQLTSITAAQAKPPTPADLVGSWRTAGLGCESVTFEADGTYSSYLHDRPFDQGKWELQGTTLVLKGNSGEDRVTDLKRQGKKKLKGKVEGRKVTWTRL